MSDFFQEINGCGFESQRNYLDVIYHTCYEQGVPWRSGSFSRRLHSVHIYEMTKRRSQNNFDITIFIIFSYSWLYVLKHVSSRQKFSGYKVFWFFLWLAKMFKSTTLITVFSLLIFFSEFSWNSHRSCSIKKVVLKNLVKFTGKHTCWSLFFDKAAGLYSPWNH